MKQLFDDLQILTLLVTTAKIFTRKRACNKFLVDSIALKSKLATLPSPLSLETLFFELESFLNSELKEIKKELAIEKKSLICWYCEDCLSSSELFLFKGKIWHQDCLKAYLVLRQKEKQTKEN